MFKYMLINLHHSNSYKHEGNYRHNRYYSEHVCHYYREDAVDFILSYESWLDCKQEKRHHELDD